jgi:hypothetical protein
MPAALLESSPKKLNKEITDDCGYHGNFKIRSGKDVTNRPGQAPLLSGARTFKFSHQKIGIKQKDDKAHFDQRPQSSPLHGSIDSLAELSALMRPCRFSGWRILANTRIRSGKWSYWEYCSLSVRTEK